MINEGPTKTVADRIRPLMGEDRPVDPELSFVVSAPDLWDLVDEVFSLRKKLADAEAWVLDYQDRE